MYDSSNERPEADVFAAALAMVPTPPASAEFDERVLEAVMTPDAPWWRRFAIPIRPALTGACCAVPLMLVLINWTVQVPPTERSTRPTPRTELTDQVMDQPYLTASALWWFTMVEPANPPGKAPAVPRSDSPDEQSTEPPSDTRGLS